MSVALESGPPPGHASGQSEARREVLAWGIETETGLVRHIRDVPRARTGSACGIKCVGCGSPLVAFNAGVPVWQVRPHVKHSKGTQRDDCEIAAARLAVVDALTKGDVLELPAHHRASSWIGLSGTRYEAWQNLPTERAASRPSATATARGR